MNIKYYFKNPGNILCLLVERFGFILSDKNYVSALYYLKMGKKLNLKNPQTYNEKLQWLKLYDRNPMYTTMVDKYTVKQYVESIIGKEYLIPTIGLWDRPEDIDWSTLPDQFVLKTTHGGGNSGVVICKDKANFDKNAAIKKLRKSYKHDIYKSHREWQYKNVIKRVLAEQYMEDSRYKELRDYKFFAFDGVVKALFIATERGTGDVKFDFFDANFNHLDLVQQHPMSGTVIQKPVCFDEMKRIASKLSQGLPAVRIDLYEVDGHVYFGEFTFTHHGGVVPFHPESWDYVFGKWIKLPPKRM